MIESAAIVRSGAACSGATVLGLLALLAPQPILSVQPGTVPRSGLLRRPAVPLATNEKLHAVPVLCMRHFRTGKGLCSRLLIPGSYPRRPICTAIWMPRLGANTHRTTPRLVDKLLFFPSRMSSYEQLATHSTRSNIQQLLPPRCALCVIPTNISAQFSETCLADSLSAERYASYPCGHPSSVFSYSARRRMSARTAPVPHISVVPSPCALRLFVTGRQQW